MFRFSGAHFNPVITLAVRMSGNMEGSKAMILYSGFQLLGGMVGAALSRVGFILKIKINYI